jgi:hypothetical protein
MMVPPNGDLSCNSFSRYSTIGGLEASDAQTPNVGMVQNLNSNFNTMWFQTIMESIQSMVPEGSPLVALTQEGVEAANLVIAERLAGNPRREPFVRNRSDDQARCARSEATSSASPNQRLANNDARRCITQNHNLCDLRNVIEDRRHHRARTPTPPRQSLAGDVPPTGKSGFCTLTAPLKEV